MQRWRGSSTVEQWTHKPLDVGSNPTLATTFLNKCCWMWVYRQYWHEANPTLATLFFPTNHYSVFKYLSGYDVPLSRHISHPRHYLFNQALLDGSLPVVLARCKFNPRHYSSKQVLLDMSLPIMVALRKSPPSPRLTEPCQQDGVYFQLCSSISKTHQHQI